MDITIIITKLKEEMKKLFAIKEEVPTKTSDLINDNDFATTASIPTKTSDLIHDSGFLTQHQNIGHKLERNSTDEILIYDYIVDDSYCHDCWLTWGQYQETLSITNTHINVPANRISEYGGGAAYWYDIADNNSIDDTQPSINVPDTITVTIKLENNVTAYAQIYSQNAINSASNKMTQNSEKTFTLDYHDVFYIYVPSGTAIFEYTVKKYSAENINTIVNITHPINSIYITSNNTNPQTFFGGRWENITSETNNYKWKRVQ